MLQIIKMYCFGSKTVQSMQLSGNVLRNLTSILARLSQLWTKCILVSSIPVFFTVNLWSMYYMINVLYPCWITLIWMSPHLVY